MKKRGLLGDDNSYSAVVSLPLPLSLSHMANFEEADEEKLDFEFIAKCTDVQELRRLVGLL